MQHHHLPLRCQQFAAIAAHAVGIPSCPAAAGSSSRNHCASGTRSGSGHPPCVDLGVWSSATVRQMSLLASSSRPPRTMSTRELVPSALSISSASSSCANTWAAPCPSHHVINNPPSFSSASIATLSMAGVPSMRTGRSLLPRLMMGSPSGVSFHRLRYLPNVSLIQSRSDGCTLRLFLVLDLWRARSKY